MTNRGLEKKPESGLGISYTPQREMDVECVFDGFETWPSAVQVREIHFDPTGQFLWGGGIGGVIRWLVTPSQTTYRMWHSEHGLAGNDVNCIFVTNDRVICGHLSGWLSIFANHRWATINTGTGFTVRALCEDGSGGVLACSDIGLFQVDTGKLLSTPEPPLSAVFMQGALWIGSNGGLWRFANGEWEYFETPIHGIAHMANSGGQLWLAGIDGAACIDSDGNVKTIARMPVYRIEPTGSNALMLTDEGIILHNAPGDLRTVSSVRSHLLALSSGARVFGGSDQIYYYLNTREINPERKLLPMPDGSMGAVRRVFNGWAQTLDGAIWRHDETRWINTHYHVTGVLSGMVRFQEQTFVSFDTVKSLAVWDGKTLSAVPAPASICVLVACSGSLWAACIDAFYTTPDSTNWSRIPYPPGMGLLRTLIPDSPAPRVVTSDGVYSVYEGRLVRQIQFTSTMTCATAANGSAWCSDGQDLLHINTGGLDTIDMPDHGHIASLIYAADRLFVGTINGLWAVDGSHDHWTVSNSGLAGVSIFDLYTDDVQVWILTSAGATVMRFGGKA